MIDPYRWLLYGAFIAALVLGYFAWAEHQQGIGYGRAQAEQTAKDLDADKKARAKESEWQSKMDGLSHDAQKQIDGLQTELSNAGAAADRLRAAAKIAASRSRPSPGAIDTGKNQPSADPIDLFIEVLDRNSRELVAVGGYADRLRISGLACEKAYSALTRD